MNDFFSSLIHFQFTTSQGGRHLRNLYPVQMYLLSIHDLTRRSTDNPAILRPRAKLSIHDLTRRSTLHHPVNATVCCLSIHDLTRRSTTEIRIYY